MERIKLALYGGTFDPVHNGHLAVAKAVCELFALDELWFIPAHIAPHKRAVPSASPFHRFAMLALATQMEARLRLSTVELESPERPYTIDTLTRLRAKYDDSARLFFVMGADSWLEIETWRDWQRVLAMVDHIVVARPGYELRTDHVPAEVSARIIDLRGKRATEAQRALVANREKRIFLTDIVQEDLSATEVRHAVRKAPETLDELVPRSVADYIRKHELYR